MHHPPEQIGSGPLLIRRWRIEEAEALEEAIAESADHLRPWMAWMSQPALSIEERRSQLRAWERRWTTGEDWNYGVFEGRQIAGGCGFHQRIGANGLELGYWTHVAFVRRGIATKVVRMLASAAFALDDINRVEIHHDEANVASAAVAARAGFSLVEKRPDEPEAPADLGIEWVWRLEKTA